MSDFDFEGLDKAIKEIVESNSSNDQAKPANKLAELTHKPAKPASANTHSDTPRYLAPTRGFRGHFMDVIHPSSDATIAHKHNFALDKKAEIPSAVNNDNLPNIDSNHTEAAQSVEDEPTYSIVQNEATSKSARNIHSRLRNPKKALTQPQPKKVTAKPVTKPAEPVQSPFLPDAVVEKRPLGEIAKSNSSIKVKAVPDETRPNSDNKSNGNDRGGEGEGGDFIDQFIDELQERHQAKAASNSHPATSKPVARPYDNSQDINSDQIRESSYAVSDASHSKYRSIPAANYAPAQLGKSVNHALLWVLLFIIVVAGGAAAGIWLYLNN